MWLRSRVRTPLRDDLRRSIRPGGYLVTTCLDRLTLETDAQQQRTMSV
jgi:hypothetical protein